MHSEKVPYFILDLLQQVPYVYVPGLGRFDAIFHPAVIDIPGAKIKPPYFEGIFTDADSDSFDLLPQFIRYVTGITTEEAIGHITDFVRTVHQRLASGSSYTIEKFGSFSKSNGSIIHFTPDWDAFNLSFRGLEEINLNPPVEVPDEPIEFFAPPVNKPQDYIPPVIERTIPAETNWVAEKVVETPTQNTLVAPVTSPAISDSTSRLWWGILAIALILITILCAYLAWDIISNRKKLKSLNQITQVTPETGTMDDVPSVVDTTYTPVKEPVEEPPVEEPADTVETIATPPPVTSIANPCFIVVGAFANPDNVSRMDERLKGMGYEVEKINSGALTKVAIKTSCDKSNLQKVLGDARSSVNPEAWIY
ncbi:MAG: hypothetical protein ABIQ11_00715 [Saprospiraceae bacterium]